MHFSLYAPKSHPSRPKNGGATAPPWGGIDRQEAPETRNACPSAYTGTVGYAFRSKLKCFFPYSRNSLPIPELHYARGNGEFPSWKLHFNGPAVPGGLRSFHPEGLAVRALVHGGVGLMGTHLDLVQRAVVLGVAVVGDVEQADVGHHARFLAVDVYPLLSVLWTPDAQNGYTAHADRCCRRDWSGANHTSNLP